MALRASVSVLLMDGDVPIISFEQVENIYAEDGASEQALLLDAWATLSDVIERAQASSARQADRLGVITSGG